MSPTSGLGNQFLYQENIFITIFLPWYHINQINHKQTQFVAEKKSNQYLEDFLNEAAGL